jgi:hypothetical protein
LANLSYCENQTATAAAQLLLLRLLLLLLLAERLHSTEFVLATKAQPHSDSQSAPSGIAQTIRDNEGQLQQRIKILCILVDDDTILNARVRTLRTPKRDTA